MPTTQRAVTAVLVVPQSDWDDTKRPGKRVTIKRVTATSVQVIEHGTGKVFSRRLAEFQSEYQPAPSTVRSQTSRPAPPPPPAARPPTPPKQQETVQQRNFRMAMEEAETEDIENLEAAAHILEHGQDDGPLVQKPSAATPPTQEPVDDRRTPTLAEQVVADWKAGMGWKALQKEHHLSGSRLKQILTPHGYVAQADNATRVEKRRVKAKELLNSPAGEREHMAPLPEEVVHVESHVVTVWPAMAAEWLERGGINRPIVDGHVQNLAAAMRRGEWRLTGEAIKLNTDGQVRDGQHRLWACIEAGTPFRTLVVINVPDDAFDVMDTGRVRRVSDILSIHNMDNTARLAPAARLAVTWLATGLPRLSTAHPVTSPQVLAFLRDHPDFSTAVLVGDRISRAGIPGGLSVWSCLVWRLSQVSAQDCEAFVQSLITGMNLGPGSPILALRNRLLGTRPRMSTSETAALTIKAWKFWRRGDQIQLLVWRQGEPYPKPE